MKTSGTIPLLLTLGAIAALSPSPLMGQQTGGSQRVEAFLECEDGSCDPEAIRNSIEWVEWVEAPEGADVAITVAPAEAVQATQLGFGISFRGSGDLQGRDDDFSVSLPEDADEERIRESLTNTISIGLARYATLMGLRNVFTVSRAGPALERGVVSPQEVDDPWNLWVFRVGASGNIDGEETRTTQRVNANFSASRTTPTWKLSFNARGSYDHQEIDRSDGSTFTNEETDWTVSGLVGYSLADHWSVGTRFSTGRLPRFNQKFRLSVTPAIEYSYFPYEEATRRSLTVTYQIGPAYRDYEEETIFGELEETLVEESLELDFSQRQSWGDASVSITGSHYLDDFDKNALSLRGDVSFRVFRGFDIDVGGNRSWTNDQVYLSARGVTDEEALLRLRQRASDSSWGVDVGFSFRFGSIFNDVVNNRFGGGGGFGGFGGFRGF